MQTEGMKVSWKGPNDVNIVEGEEQEEPSEYVLVAASESELRQIEQLIEDCKSFHAVEDDEDAAAEDCEFPFSSDLFIFIFHTPFFSI